MSKGRGTVVIVREGSDCFFRTIIFLDKIIKTCHVY